MAKDTRQDLLDSAEALFAARGFYGVSLAAIADELGLTKQALLHHFGSKEKLYGAVLSRISEDYRDKQQAVLAGRDEAATPIQALTAYLMALAEDTPQAKQRTSLLMRELLDNNQRAAAAGSWYLADFLARLTAMVKAVPEKADLTEAEALALAYQLLGAMNYFAISQPTLTAILGTSDYKNLHQAFFVRLEKLIAISLAADESEGS